MEDAHCVKMGLPGAPNSHFFGVFDGHGGSFTSQQASSMLVDKIVSGKRWEEAQKSPEEMASAIRAAFLECDEELRLLPGADTSGSTAVVALVTETHIIVANCGDSRCVLVRGGEAVGLSDDHKCSRVDETSRIHRAGGAVIRNRVNGELTVSRSLGDFPFKKDKSLPAVEQLVIALPDIEIVERTPEDQYLVLACDGIWDVFSNEEMASWVGEAAAGMAGDAEKDLVEVAEKLLDVCLFERNSRDNMSVILAAFPGTDCSKGKAERVAEAAEAGPN